MLASEHKDLEVSTGPPALESSDEAISSMSEDSADSSNRQQAIPNVTAASASGVVER